MVLLHCHLIATCSFPIVQPETDNTLHPMARCVSGSVVLALLCIVVSAPPTHASNDDSSVAMARIKKMNQFNYGGCRMAGAAV